MTSIDPPPWLSAEASEVWRREAPDQIALGVLTRSDAFAFSLLCEVAADYHAGRAALDTLEPTDRNRFKLEAVVHRQRDHIFKLAGEFGMTPASRSKLSVLPRKPANKFDVFN